MKFQQASISGIKVCPPKMKCDIPYNPPPDVECLSPYSHFYGIIAPPGGGKTSLMTNLITRKDMYRKRFNNIFTFCPNNSRASIPGLFKKLDPNKCFEALDSQSINHVVEQLKRESTDGKFSLIILDDMMAFLKDKEVSKALNYITANRRHLKTAIWVLSQSYKSIPLTTRKQLSHMFYFKPRSRAEMKAISDEVLFLEPKDTGALFDYVFDDPDDKHRFLLVNMNDGKFYKNFDELVMVEN